MIIRACLPFLLLLAAAGAQAQTPPTYKDFERKPVVLSENEFERLRTAVMTRCHVPERTDLAGAPWYFPYELGLELEKRGDPQRALDAFIAALQRRPDPKRGSRMYGLWFIDYQPYFEIAKTHAALGNWQCAADALRLSAEKKEIKEEDSRFFEFLELSEELRLRTQRQPG